MRAALHDDVLAALLDAHAPMKPCALATGIRAWHAPDEIPLWEALERACGTKIDTPFFCVPWPGALGLARATEDGVVDVRGAVVADVGCGSGVASIAASLRGAKRVRAIDVDPLAVRAARILARRHGLDDGILDAVVGSFDAAAGADVVVAGDVVYSQTQLPAWRAFVERHRHRVVVADSGRPFFDACGLTCVASYDVDVERTVDGAARRTVRVFPHVP